LEGPVSAVKRVEEAWIIPVRSQLPDMGDSHRHK
jgi:hypothetical protein